MNTKKFKKLLRESLESDLFSRIEEVSLRGRKRKPGSVVSHAAGLNAMRYALVKYLNYRMEKYAAETDGVQKVTTVSPQMKKQIKKDFVKVMKDLKLFVTDPEAGTTGIDGGTFDKLYRRYHKDSKIFKYKGQKLRASNSLWNVLKLKMDKAEASDMDYEEYGEFSEKQIARLADKIDDAIQEIEEASQELTTENLLTLLKYFMFQHTLESPDQMKNLHGSFGGFVKNTLNSFYAGGEGRNIKQLYNGILELIARSPLYSSGAAKIVSDLLKKDMQKTLFHLDDLLTKEPHGFRFGGNVDYIEKAIADYKTGASQLNESLQHGEVKEYLESFLPFAKKRLGYDREPKITFASDPENGQLTLGKTAYYEPQSMAVTVFTDNRHPKDIMRSLSHELVHHAQNCDGQFDRNLGVGEGYAQNDEHLRKMEEDAYLRGNMCFRDWEDGFKQNNPLMEKRERLYYELLRRFK